MAQKEYIAACQEGQQETPQKPEEDRAPRGPPIHSGKRKKLSGADLEDMHTEGIAHYLKEFCSKNAGALPGSCSARAGEWPPARLRNRP